MERDNDNQLFIAMSLIRYGFNPQDPEAWVEEPVRDAMDFMNLNWRLTGKRWTRTLQRTWLLTKGRVPKSKAECQRQSANQSVSLSEMAQLRFSGQ